MLKLRPLREESRNVCSRTSFSPVVQWLQWFISCAASGVFGCGVNDVSLDRPANVDPAPNQEVRLSGAESSACGETLQLLDRSAIFRIQILKQLHFF